MQLRTILVLGIVTLLSTLCRAQSGLTNPDFLKDATGSPPKSWLVLPPGTPAKIVADDASPTKRSVQLGPPADGQAMANLMQQLDATPFRGKRIILRADIRLAPHDSLTQLKNAKAQMWVRVDRQNGQTGFFNNMDDRPIRGLRAMNFQSYSISGVVDADAQTLNVGVMAIGETVVHVARFTLLTADANEHPDAAPAPLSARGLDNLMALARLYGYVRYFHPSDEAVTTDWEPYLVAAIERVEEAGDAAQLTERLAGVFTPIAPTVQIWAGDASGAPAEPAPPEGASGYTAWRHLGVNVNGQTPGRSIYTSRRIQASLDKPSDEIPMPGTCVVKDLGGGVSCRVPVTVRIDAEKRTLPHAAGEVIAPKRPEWWTPSGNDRTARLAGVMEAWNVFQHFYPYFDVSDADWPRVLRDSLRSAATDADEPAYLRTLQRLDAERDDGHGIVAPINLPRPRPFNAVFDWVGDRLVVVKAGEGEKDIRAGDEIVAVAGVPTPEWYKECRTRISAATPQWARWRACSDQTYFGWTDGPIEMTFKREGKEFKASPGRVAPEQALKEDRPTNGSEVAPGIVYFNLDGAEVAAWQAALPALQAAKGIVLDMRGYPGGAGMVMLRHLTDSMIQSAMWIVPITLLPDREGVVWQDMSRWKLQPAEPRLGADSQKVVVITDGRAISYAESCMGIIEAYKLAEIVGGPTAGTNGNINPFSVCGGYYISWTGMKVLKNDASRHHGVGIKPTIPVSRTIAGIAAGRDELLEAAIKAAQPEK
jgi:hypothetical protein